MSSLKTSFDRNYRVLPGVGAELEKNALVFLKNKFRVTRAWTTDSPLPPRISQYQQYGLKTGTLYPIGEVIEKLGSARNKKK
ncbi:hypothetical protein HY993_01675 [Candidatus Micrarchaeota archaeon]|nr:hypothetical protein [Candidatus Micrarchaeota archaeon]